VAVCLLFPCEKITGPRRAELRAQRASGAALAPPPELFFLQQHDGIGNACGTIAAIHAVTAGVAAGAFSLGEGPLKSFLDRLNPGLSAAERGWELNKEVALQEMSDAVAAAGETQGAGTDDAMDSHFISFVQFGGLQRIHPFIPDAVPAQILTLSGSATRFDRQRCPAATNQPLWVNLLCSGT